MDQHPTIQGRCRESIEAFLDEPIELPKHASLIVTVLRDPSESESEMDELWLHATAASDTFAFLADPVEDIYCPEDGEPFRDAIWGRPGSVPLRRPLRAESQDAAPS